MIEWLRYLFRPVPWYGTLYSALYGVPIEATRAVVRAEGWVDSAPTWEPTVQEYSYGPMQVLGSTARDMGYRGPPSELHRPDIGMRYGVLFLRRQISKYGICDGISAYNAGRPSSYNTAYVCRGAPWCGRC